MYDGEELLHEWYEEAEIKSGETVQMEISLPVPLSEEQKTCTVTADAVDYDDADPANNTVEITFGSTDLSVEAAEILTGSGGLMKITVTNHGGYASDAVIGIYSDEGLTELIDTVDAGIVDKKSLTAVNYPTDNLPEIVYLQVAGSREELYEHNNRCLFFRSADTAKKYTVSGSITSYGDSTVPVTICVLDSDENEITRFNTTDGTYTVELPAGSYILEVGKVNHVTRCYNITVGP